MVARANVEGKDLKYDESSEEWKEDKKVDIAYSVYNKEKDKVEEEILGEPLMEKEDKLGPKALSSIGLEDKDFEIKDGEIKHLPVDWEERPGISHWVKLGRLKILEINKSKEQEKDVTLDKKDLYNFLNQNSRTVLRQLKINDLSKKDLQKLLIAERNDKCRSNVMKFIKALLEVS